MINISGSTQRSFIFPATLESTVGFFTDIGRILHYLPHISIEQIYNHQNFRLLYRTAELGLYRVNIYCDIAAELELDNHCLRIKPFQPSSPPFHSRAGLYYLVCQGYFSSTSYFKPVHEGTEVDYSLELAADMPMPYAAMLMPDGIAEALANSIMQKRMHEIIDGFIARSIRAYRQLSQG